MPDGHLELIRRRREAALQRATEARRRAGLARAHEANAIDSEAAARYNDEALTHERAVLLQQEAAESQRVHQAAAED